MDDKDFQKAKRDLQLMMDKLRTLEGESQGSPYCSFCHRGKGQYACCVEGASNVRICDVCVMQAYSLVLETCTDLFG